MLREQMIGLQAAVRLKIGEMGRSAEEVYSQGREHADHARPSCSCATRTAGRMASRIATGALSRTRGSPGAAWCSGTCCTWARSTAPGISVATGSIEVLEGAAQPRTLYNSAFSRETSATPVTDASPSVVTGSTERKVAPYLRFTCGSLLAQYQFTSNITRPALRVDRRA